MFCLCVGEAPVRYDGCFNSLKIFLQLVEDEEEVSCYDVISGYCVVPAYT